jgi:hypothetical protein
MSSFAFDNFMLKLVQALFNGASFKVMLTTSADVPSEGNDIYRSGVTGEVAAGNGYTTGGQAIVPTIALDTTTHKVTVTFPAVSWPSSTITARHARYYLSTGNAATDLMIAQDDFGADVSSTNGPFSLAATSITLNTPS